MTKLTLFAGLLLCASPNVFAYAVMAHQAMIDAAWESDLAPLLRARFPNATADEVRQARAYAYGGSIIQDLGYYPFGNGFFSDLVHYVHEGGFITALIREAQDVNEYAFALGALAHEAADACGHPIATNRVVPMLYPKLRRKFGDHVTYEEGRSAHLKVEFAFDVVQVAHGNYPPEAWRDVVGFEISKPVMERAFLTAYGVEMKDLFFSLDLALGTYRWAVSSLIPHMTKVAWEMKKNEIPPAQQSAARAKFVQNIRRAEFERRWGRQYRRPGWGARFLATILQIVPKVGPFRALSFRTPTPEAQKLFMQGFNASMDRFRGHLKEIREGRMPQIPDDNLDTGEVAQYGDYRLADQTWAKLVLKLAKSGAKDDLRRALRAYYDTQTPSDPKAAAALKALLDEGEAVQAR